MPVSLCECVDNNSLEGTAVLKDFICLYAVAPVSDTCWLEVSMDEQETEWINHW